MSMNKVERIRNKATELGAKPGDWRKWKFRKRIPSEWRERIFLASSGAINFHDMDKIFNGVQEAESLKAEAKYTSKPETEQVRANPPTPAK